MLNSDIKLRTTDIEKFKIAYFPVPKIASTSVKYALHQMATDTPFENTDPDGKHIPIHSEDRPTRRFYALDHQQYQDYHRIAIIRDPAERILSAYRHRVVDLKELSENRIDMDLAHRLNVPANPERHIFLRHLNKYRLLSPSVRHHTDHFTYFLGADLKYFTHVYKITQLELLGGFLSELAGRKIEVGHHLKASQKARATRLRSSALTDLRTYCAGDYALMRGYFSPPE